MTIDELIARLEEATEGSFDLDCEVWDAIGDGALGLHKPRSIKRYTTSLDAALSLVPEGLMLMLKSGWKPGPWLVHLEREEGPAVQWVAGAYSSTAPLALCIASLKARKLGK